MQSDLCRIASPEPHFPPPAPCATSQNSGSMLLQRAASGRFFVEDSQSLMLSAVVPQLLLPPQHFSGNPLDRTYDRRLKFDGTSKSDEISLVVVAGREVCALLLNATDPELDLNSESICLTWVYGDAAYQLPLYLLGQDRTERWTFALDVSDCRTGFMEFLRDTCSLGGGVALSDLRAALPQLSRDAAAIAGQATALSQWHQSHKFCPRCGAPTAPVEAGLRRQCTATPHHKVYPRTDPVVIMLVESPDGRRALLGRNKKFTPGMYTCLSGFVDQCESVEEAVRREVFEESRVLVAQVTVVGSQPWPIGRYGGCELMLGCMAKARSYEVLVNMEEMEDVQWYDKDELRAAVRMYDVMNPLPESDGVAELPMSVAQLQERSLEQLGFFIPPPLAIAHHLIRTWALHDGPWFPGFAAAGAAAAAAAVTGAASHASYTASPQSAQPNATAGHHNHQHYNHNNNNNNNQHYNHHHQQQLQQQQQGYVPNGLGNGKGVGNGKSGSEASVVSGGQDATGAHTRGRL
ncbi:hypothetical protein VOLCADRAFT_118984 [Volvox carteri f. nagariensis]|uniref:NAD(+) diphosphatase n=1 Tax=Volvox carteri f. nagariensis TaxID=3068 RepID=D8U965_VOLCA|nr:uncharacterized protein VOLCADRAFT_118984 [Volvox carteri f. nagariensis]EFJ43697.1 hypothetical protein VOLCADRAFT_118984 [Volvox carteri f. nagariensis]|eukprot:XP_002955178.1 hypothetical protein VOLCADRAFT_118984 [Volvox carteri f. nagariensis]